MKHIPLGEPVVALTQHTINPMPSWLDTLSEAMGLSRPALIGLMCVPVLGWLALLFWGAARHDTLLTRHQRLLHEIVDEDTNLTTVQRRLLHQAVDGLDDLNEASELLSAMDTE